MFASNELLSRSHNKQNAEAAIQEGIVEVVECSSRHKLAFNACRCGVAFLTKKMERIPFVFLDTINRVPSAHNLITDIPQNYHW